MADHLQKMSNFNWLARRFAARLLRRGAPTRRASAIFTRAIFSPFGRVRYLFLVFLAPPARARKTFFSL
jgi:hypothetical protein